MADYPVCKPWTGKRQTREFILQGSGSSDRLTDTKPTGDLDASVYWPDSPSARSGSGKEKHNSQFRYMYILLKATVTVYINFFLLL